MYVITDPAHREDKVLNQKGHVFVIKEYARGEKMSNLYRAEDGQRGDGRWPPQARDTGRGMRSRVEVYRRPPEQSEGCVCGISPEAEGVRTQSRRHLNAVKVETGRGKGAKRLAGPRLHIDDGCLGEGEGGLTEVTRITFGQDDPAHPDYPDFYDDYKNGGHFDSNRKDIFHYVIFCDECWARKGTDPFNSNRAGRGNRPGDDFVVCSSNSDYTFMHELGHNYHLRHSMECDGTFPYTEYTTRADARKSVMYYRSADATDGYTYDQLWSYLDLRGVNDASDSN